MGRKTKLQKTQEELESVKLKLHNEEVLHGNTQGKLETYEAKEERHDSEMREASHRRERYVDTLEDQVKWMRCLVEDLAMPKDKLEIIMEARREIHVEGHPQSITAPHLRGR